MPHTPVVSALMAAPLLAILPGSGLAAGTAGQQQGNELLSFVRTVQVTPDATFQTGSFVRINAVEATGHLVVTFGTKADPQAAACRGAGYAYKEYTEELEETGGAGQLLWWGDQACEAGNSSSLLVGDSYYLATVPQAAGYGYGWRLMRFDATTWTPLTDLFVPLDQPHEAGLDPTLALVNGQVDVSDQYNPSGIWQEGSASFHHFFSPDLVPLGTRILSDSPHIAGSAMIQVDGFIYLVSANEYTGDLVVLKYDADWNYLGTKPLKAMAHWSQGVAYDGQRFYVAYLDTSQRTPETFFPVYLNVRLAAFDRDWNMLADVAVTSFTPTDLRQPGRPWVLLKGNRLYVAYDCDTLDPVTGEEQRLWQAFVSVYEVRQTRSVHRVLRSVPDCNVGVYGAGVERIGMMESSDHGASWQFKGHACFHAPALTPVDPSALFDGGELVLYFFDLMSFDSPTHTFRIYRTAARDAAGLDFSLPAEVFELSDTEFTDPAVIKLPSQTYRMYLHSTSGIISASSADGRSFTEDAGIRTEGAVPGALVLPDGKVRLFISGGGIMSLISDDGLAFTAEPGVRIALPAGAPVVADPHPIRCADGVYRMVYKVKPTAGGVELDEIYLADSADGYTWNPGQTSLRKGSVPTLVELPDGRLRIYFVDFAYE
jgi:hypothetical protein